MSQKKTNQRRSRIRGRIRSRIRGTSQQPRLCVFRSNRHIYAQVINDEMGHTLAAASSVESGVDNGKPIEVGRSVGRLLAERAKAAGVQGVVFDRNVYRYMGRVKALADGAREGGLAF